MVKRIWNCTAASEMWKESSIKLPTRISLQRDFINIIWLMKDFAMDIDWELFATTAKGIWKNRNLVKLEARCKLAKTIARDASNYMEEFRQNHVPNDTNHRSRGRNRTLWRPPRRGWHKVNIDEAVLKEAGNYDVGAVVKNEKGELMGAMCKKNTFPIGGFGGGSKSGRRRNYLCNGSQSWGSNNRRRYFNGNVCP